LICTIPLLGSLFPTDSSLHRTLASYLSTAFCFANLFFLGLAQRDVGRSSPSPRLHKALLLLLILSLLLTFPLLPIILPSLSNTNYLLPLLLLVTALLATSTAYLQSAVFALAALWSTPAVLGVMSGQGGIAVIVSGAQVILAIISALQTSPSGHENGGEGGESKVAGVGLWAIAAVGAFGCMLAHRFLIRHEGYGRALGPVIHRQEDRDGGKVERRKTMRLLTANWEVNLAVAWVFVVTLVSLASPALKSDLLNPYQAVFPPITTAIVSIRPDPPTLLKPAVFIPLHFFLFNSRLPCPAGGCSG
jgi:equilibrative nucleoside transporter 1/2/3